MISLRDRIKQRSPDVYIGGEFEKAYMVRWWVIPRNKYFNIYLHHFLRSDEDRALHDHPWWNISYLIEGSYIEHTVKDGQPIETVRWAGDWAFRKAEVAHRIQLHPMFFDGELAEEWRELSKLMPCWTLFITGPKLRHWGFHCPKGWIPWEQFTGQDEKNGPVRVGLRGPGCGED